jgi:hypothetical protein
VKKIYTRRKFLKKRNAASYRPAWRFPPIVELEIQKWILHPCLHVCSGQSTLGDVKLDLYEKADVKAAMRYLPFRPKAFASIIWDPPYAMHRQQTMPVLIELREALRVGGRLISLHYFDPSNFLQRSMRLLYKSYYDSKQMGGVRVLTVIERLPAMRIPPKRCDSLFPIPISRYEQGQLELTARLVHVT